MLLSHNIKPILVFDGRHLPAKADTEAKRREYVFFASQIPNAALPINHFLRFFFMNSNF